MPEFKPGALNPLLRESMSRVEDLPSMEEMASVAACLGEPADHLEILARLRRADYRMHEFKEMVLGSDPSFKDAEPPVILGWFEDLARAKLVGPVALESLAGDTAKPDWLREEAAANHKFRNFSSDGLIGSEEAPSWLEETLRSLSEKYGWSGAQSVRTPTDANIAPDFSLTVGAETFHGPAALAGATAGGHFGAGESLTPAYIEVQATHEATLKITVEVDPRDKRGAETYLLAGSPSKGVWRSVLLTEREDGVFEATAGGEFASFVSSLEDAFYAVLFNE